VVLRRHRQSGLDQRRQVRHCCRPEAERGRNGQVDRRMDQGLHPGAGDDHDAGVRRAAGVVQNAEDLLSDPQMKTPAAFPGADPRCHRTSLVSRAGLQALRNTLRDQESGADSGPGQPVRLQKSWVSTDDDIADMIVEGVITTNTTLRSRRIIAAMNTTLARNPHAPGGRFSGGGNDGVAARGRPQLSSSSRKNGESRVV